MFGFKIDGLKLSGALGNQMAFMRSQTFTPPPPPYIIAATSTNIVYSITGLNYVQDGGPSAASTPFKIMAEGLSPSAGSIIVTPPADFEVFDGITWYSTPFLVGYTAGVINTALIYKVRLKAGLLMNSYAENVILSGANAADFIIQVSGQVKRSVILQNGLLWWHDPSRQNSYPGTGTDLIDISGNGNNLIINQPPNFQDGNSFYLNGSETISGNIFFPETSDITIFQWFKGTSNVLAQAPFILNPNSSQVNIIFDINDSDLGPSARTAWIYWFGNGSPRITIPIGAIGGTGPRSDLLDGNWHCLAFRRNTTTFPYTDVFINGVKVSVVSRDGDQNGLGPAGVGFIGQGILIGTRFDGNVGADYGYTLALTDAEIMYNYMVDAPTFT